MKTINRILLTAAVAVSFTLANRASAGVEAVLSPKAQSLNHPVVAGSSKNDPDLAHGQAQIGSPKAQSINHPVVAGSSKNDPDLVRLGRTTLSPKLQDLLGPRAKKFEIAPIK